MYELGFLVLVLTLLSPIHPHSIGFHGCGGRVDIEEAIELELEQYEKCVWDFHTNNDRILVFSVTGGNYQDAQNFFALQDGLNEDSPILLLENQKLHESSRKDLPSVVYTTGSTARLFLKKRPSFPLKLKIQKAVDCPFNLGSNSQCGRVVDEVSCYCATFTKRSQPDQKQFCSDNGMLLLSLESATEESSVTTAWGTSERYWTSLSDDAMEDFWIWETTGGVLTGHINWYPGQPDNGGVFYNEDCMTLNYAPSGWGDTQCKDSWSAICEQHP